MPFRRTQLHIMAAMSTKFQRDWMKNVEGNLPKDTSIRRTNAIS